MKTTLKYLAPLALGAGLCLPGLAEEEAALTPAEKEAKLEKHEDGSQKLANEQDELAADVQELIDVQTADDVIKLLEEVEEIMGEVIDQLDESDTGGETIAAETEIIEKIFEAAQKRAQQGGGT